MESQGPLCQSCAMPMTDRRLHGTNADGVASDEYCRYCFQNGAFTEPDITLRAMMDKCVGIIVQKNVMPEEDARKVMARTLPHLKRWKR